MNYQLLDVLHQHGLRNTGPRQTILQLLADNGAITIRELRRRVAGQLDTASLYRTLTVFRNLGIVQDVVIAGQRKVELADMFTPHHHHLACSTCGRAQRIHDEAFEHSIERLAAAYGFSHQSHSFEITGLCSECRQNRLHQPLIS